MLRTKEIEKVEFEEELTGEICEKCGKTYGDQTRTVRCFCSMHRISGVQKHQADRTDPSM